MIVIKTYTRDMQTQLFDLTERCFEQCGKKFEPDGRHAFYCDIVQNFVQFWCAFDGEAMIGTSALKDLGDGKCELKALYLDENYHGKGIGRQLAQAAIDFARDKGYGEMYLDCMSGSDKAIALYEKLGFHKIKRYNNNVFADIFMALSL